MLSSKFSRLKAFLAVRCNKQTPAKRRPRVRKKPGGSSRRSHNIQIGFEKLEDRDLLAAVTLTGGTIFVVGDNTADQIAISEAGNNIVVKVNDLAPKVFSESLVAQIIVWGRDGNDRIDNSTHKFSELFGQLGNDLLVGGYVTDSISGGDGDDTVIGRGQDDFLLGGAGNDTLNGGAGNDKINGGDGDDLLLGDTGNDALFGSAGNDRLWGQAGDDQLIGSSDSNQMHGGLGNDSIYGGAGVDNIWGGDGQDTISGGLGNDWISGEAGDDHLLGGDGNDFIKGDLGNDYIAGGGGNDRGEGGAGNDIIDGGVGSDSLFGRSGNDVVRGNHGHDLLDGGAGDDSLEGGAGQDELSGGAGNDRLIGGDQNDRLFGNAGADWIDGGNGNDGLFGGIGSGSDQLIGGLGSDRFLVFEDNDNIVDARPLEGVVRFANSASNYRFEYGERLSNWSEAEIRAVDDGLQAVHNRVGSSILLRSNMGGGPMTFVKTDGGSRGYYGANYDRGSRLIALNLVNSSVYGGRFDPNNASDWDHVGRLVQHELGHSWDSTAEIRRTLGGSDIWNRFVDLEEQGIRWNSGLSSIESFGDAMDYAIDNTTINDHRQPILNLFNELFADLRNMGW